MQPTSIGLGIQIRQCFLKYLLSVSKEKSVKFKYGFLLIIIMSGFRRRQDMVFEEIESLALNQNSLVPDRDFGSDPRLCLTLVHFPEFHLQSEILDKVLQPLIAADSSLYFYPKESLHVTVQNIRKIDNPQNFTPVDIKKVILLETLKSFPCLQMELSGLCKLPNSIAIKCYPDKVTSDFILRLRRELSSIGLPDDKHYVNPDVIVANITVCRYLEKPNTAFFDACEKLRSVRLGTVDIRTISLVSTNLVCALTKVHHVFGKG